MKYQGDILIVDDDPDIIQSARVVLRPHFGQVRAESDPRQLPYLINRQQPDVVLLDMNFSADVTKGSEGLFWLKKILEDSPTLSVVMVTAFGDVKLAVEAMKLGAVDFVVKPWDNEKFLATVNAALQLSHSKKELSRLRAQQSGMVEVYAKPESDLVGKSKAMEVIFTLMRKVANTDANVLILGENGTGKELIAKALHQHSTRRDENFVKVDVGTIPDTLFESELFGHVKGAFTDARQDRIGRFELASGGTLFLDEIGNLSLSLQSKLLSVLQNRNVTRLGSNQQIPIDIRLICATNKSVKALVADGLFREDLLYRINTFEITLPPLRERMGDIPLLLDHFLKVYNRKYGKRLEYTQQLIHGLESYRWPGNVRELQHATERAVILCDTKQLSLVDFQLTASQNHEEQNTTNLSGVERRAISEAIKKNNGNLSQAAKELGLGRTTLYRKIEKYGL